VVWEGGGREPAPYPIMGHVRGESRDQGAPFPVSLDELIPADHLCRVIDAFVVRLDLGKLGFARASPAASGRPPYDPADLLKRYVYGYLQQVRSSRRLEADAAPAPRWRSASSAIT